MNIEIAKLLDSNFLTYVLEGKNIDENDVDLLERLTDLLALVNDEYCRAGHYTIAAI